MHAESMTESGRPSPSMVRRQPTCAKRRRPRPRSSNPKNPARGTSKARRAVMFPAPWLWVGPAPVSNWGNSQVVECRASCVWDCFAVGVGGTAGIGVVNRETGHPNAANGPGRHQRGPLDRERLCESCRGQDPVACLMGATGSARDRWGDKPASAGSWVSWWTRKVAGASLTRRTRPGFGWRTSRTETTPSVWDPSEGRRRLERGNNVEE